MIFDGARPEKKSVELFDGGSFGARTAQSREKDFL